jgi:cytochrome d ubiquinol oxidase subunit I
VWFLRLCQVVAPLGFVAVIAGWITTEVGRQPWTVYGVLRTADSVSPSLTGGNVAWSLAFYIIVYLIMFPTGIGFMASLVRRGPQQGDLEPPRDEIESGRPHQPFEHAARAAPQP